MSDQMNNNGRNEQEARAFNPNEHLIQLKSRDGLKDYLPVQWRLVWFREQCPQGTIDTEELEYDTEKEYSIETMAWNAEKKRSEKVIKTAKGYARYRAIVTDGKGGRATGTKSECRANFDDFGEKAETGAIGRALAALGYGTQFAPELDEEHRIVDAPVERQGSEAKNISNGNYTQRSVTPVQRMVAETNARYGEGTAASDEPEALITERQMVSIRKLCETLGRAEPDNLSAMSFASAKELIQQLSLVYNEQRQSRKAS